MNWISWSAGLVALVAAIGGVVVTSDSRYESKEYSREQFASVSQQLEQSRLNDVDSRIIQLQKERERRRLSDFEQDVLRRLLQERKLLLCRMKLEKCS